MREDFDRMDEEVPRAVPDNLLPGGLPQEATASGSAEGPTPISAWESDSEAAKRNAAEVAKDATDQPADCTDAAATGAAAEVSTSFEDVALSLEPSAPHALAQGAPSASPPHETPASIVPCPQPPRPLTAAEARRLVLPPLQSPPHRGPSLRPSKTSPSVLPVALSPAPAITYGVVPPESKASRNNDGSEGFMLKCMEDTATHSCADSITKVLLEHQAPSQSRCKGRVVALATSALAVGATGSVALVPFQDSCSEDVHATVRIDALSWLLLAAVLPVFALSVSVMEHSAFLMRRSFAAWTGLAETFITFGKFLVFFSFACHAAALQPGDAHAASLVLASRICIIVHSVLSVIMSFYLGHILRSLPIIFREDRPDRPRNVLSAQLLWFGAVAGTLGVGLRGLRYGNQSLNACVFGSIFAPMRLLAVFLLDVPHLVLGCLLLIHSRMPTSALKNHCLEEEQVLRAEFMAALGVAAMLAATVSLMLAVKTCRFDWRWLMYGSSYRQRMDFLAKKEKSAPRWRSMQRSLRKAKREARLKKERGDTDLNAAAGLADSTPKTDCQKEANSA